MRPTPSHARKGVARPRPGETLATGGDRAIERQTAPPVFYIAPPLIHGTGLFAAISVLTLGGTIVCSRSHSFSARETLRAIAASQRTGLVLYGDGQQLDACESARLLPLIGSADSYDDKPKNWANQSPSGSQTFSPSRPASAGA